MLQTLILSHNSITSLSEPSTAPGDSSRQQRHEPIPANMAGCPVQGGLAVPVIAGQHRNPDHPALFGINDPAQANICLHDKLCGGCGRPLQQSQESTYTLLLRPADFAHGYTREPALHTNGCGPYSVRACPWLNGQMTSYRRTPRDLEAQRCGDSKCACRLWRTTDDHRARAGRPLPPIFSATYAVHDYTLDWGTLRGHHDLLRGICVTGVDPVNVRLIRAGTWSLMDVVFAKMAGLPVSDADVNSLLDQAG